MTGNALKKWREKLGLSQTELAEKLDVAGSTIARQEQQRDKEISHSRLYEYSLKHLEGLKDFDITAAIRSLNEPHLIMNDWFQFEGRDYPQDFGVAFFKGWESFGFEEKVEALRDAKRVLDRSLKNS